jgi:maltose alpha-D-glucosyltransferase/alpha-amylase
MLSLLIGDNPYLITLAPYGFFWFQLCEHAPGSVDAPSIVSEFETLVVNKGLSSLWQGRSRIVLEGDVLPAFLAGRRWFAEKSDAARATTIDTTIPLG